MRRGDWQARFGAARRARDRELMGALERQIALEELVAGLGAGAYGVSRLEALAERRRAAEAEAAEELERRARLARAFGRSA